MYVCHCEAVSDRTVNAAISSGARYIEDVTQRVSGRRSLRSAARVGNVSVALRPGPVSPTIEAMCSGQSRGARDR